jgi:nucleotide-binding universal stress UspA family protein
MKRIVVGLGGTQSDLHVVDWVGDLADEVGVHVVAAHFVPRTTVWMIAGAQMDSSPYLGELRDHFETGAVARLRRLAPSVHLHVDLGDPAHELAALAHTTDAGMIAIGAPDHSALHDAVFGSVAYRLMHLTDVPVVAVPRPARTLTVLHGVG